MQRIRHIYESNQMDKQNQVDRYGSNLTGIDRLIGINLDRYEHIYLNK